MKNLAKHLLIIAFLSASCQEEQVDRGISGEWTIPITQVFDGGPGKDGIPALLNPNMVDATSPSLDYLNDNDLVIGIKRGDDIRAYAHPILDWHEIINDQIGDDHIAITYCPLTGTAIGWDRTVNNEVTTFGVSGLLYQSNLIPYDRKTDSNYSQMLTIGVNGDQTDVRPEIHHMVETTWATWKSWYPDTKVTSNFTGHSRSYGFYPYGDYKTSSSLIFPINFPDTRLHTKERVLGVVGQNQSVLAFQFDLFANRRVINTTVDEESLIVVGSSTENWMIAFKVAEVDGEQLNFSVVEQGSIVLEDNLGNQYDSFGVAVSGPNAGLQLETFESFIGYWFAWATFYREIDIFTE